MAFEHGNGIMQGKPEGYRKKRKEDFDIIYEIIEATTLNTFVSEPVADKKYDGTKYEEAQQRENDIELGIKLFDVHGRDAQNRHQKHA